MEGYKQQDTVAKQLALDPPPVHGSSKPSWDARLQHLSQKISTRAAGVPKAPMTAEEPSLSIGKALEVSIATGGKHEDCLPPLMSPESKCSRSS